MTLMVFLFGCFAGVVAGVCAYLIALDELQHHFRSRRPARLEALRQAVFAAGFFVLLGGVLAFFLPYLFTTR
ncbi:MAG TPA: hypothetical protein VHX38_39805 [Pseudonocardiaceae bacterium]|jgi:H+/Cl- antiporter ClcA|nr:hypothetical protein [Pseudonocardiaceae bacterium]